MSTHRGTAGPQAESAVRAAERLGRARCRARAIPRQEGRAHRAASRARQAAGGRNPGAGKAINDAKAALTSSIDARRDELEEREARARARRRRARRHAARARSSAAGLHPVTRAAPHASRSFRTPASTSPTVPRSRTTSTTSDALNIPEDHPARAMHDTFYFATAGCCARIPRRADPRDDGSTAADPSHRAGPRLSLRLRLDAYADVPRRSRAWWSTRASASRT